jgi:hypothetical protein
VSCQACSCITDIRYHRLAQDRSPRARRRAPAHELACRLLRLLAATSVAANRLKGLLPEGVVVRHRPGTSGTTNGQTAATNDHGIVDLPGDRGHFVMAAMVSRSSQGLEQCERKIARIARAAYDARTAPAPGR